MEPITLQGTKKTSRILKFNHALLKLLTVNDIPVEQLNAPAQIDPCYVTKICSTPITNIKPALELPHLKIILG